MRSLRARKKHILNMAKKEVKTPKESQPDKIFVMFFKFLLATIIPLINFIIIGVVMTTKEISMYFGPLFFVFLAFFGTILYKILKTEDEKYRIGAMMLYAIGIFLSVIIYAGSNISVYFPSFFTAYVVYLATNFDKFEFFSVKSK